MTVLESWKKKLLSDFLVPVGSEDVPPKSKAVFRAETTQITNQSDGYVSDA